jgi:hypothetical protein
MKKNLVIAIGGNQASTKRTLAKKNYQFFN